jgi:hypothetical protein
VKDAFDLPSPAPPETIRFTIPSRHAGLAVHRLRASGYDVAARSHGARWRIAISSVAPSELPRLERLLSEVDPKAHRLD